MNCSCCQPHEPMFREILPPGEEAHRARKIIVDVLAVTGAEPFEVFGEHRGTADVALTRALIATRIRSEVKMSYPEIGRLLGRHHASVILMVKRTRKMLTEAAA